MRFCNTKKKKQCNRLITLLLIWCRRQESNSRPPDYKSGALPLKLLRHKAKIYKENPGEKPRQTFMRWPRSFHQLFRGLMLAQTLFNVPKDEQLYPSALITALLPGWLDFEALQADNN